MFWNNELKIIQYSNYISNLPDDGRIRSKDIVEETLMRGNIVAYKQSTNIARSCTSKTAPAN
jgi:hypothetical protein